MRVLRLGFLSALLSIGFGAMYLGEAQNKVIPASSIRAASAILIEDGDGVELFAKEPDRILPPASTTKIVTGMLLARDVPQDTLITVSPRAAATPGSRLGLRAGDRLPARDILYAIMLSSANDASAAVAEQMDGSEARFANRMNAEAQRSGARRTHFVNPHGMPASGHVSTVRDLATLAAAALKVPAFAAAARARTYRLTSPNSHLPGTLTSQDPLLGTFPGAEGIKTGYTKEAGNCYVGSATRNGRRLIVALLNSPDCEGDARRLLEYGFAQPPQSEANKLVLNGGGGSPGDHSGLTPSTLSGGPNVLGTPYTRGSKHGEPLSSTSPRPTAAASETGGRPGAALGFGTPAYALPAGRGPNNRLSDVAGRTPHALKTAGLQPNTHRKNAAAAVAMISTHSQPLPTRDSTGSLWWLWLLLLLLLLILMRRHLARQRDYLMNSLSKPFSRLGLRISAASSFVHKTPQYVPNTLTTIAPQPTDFTFSVPCIPRRSASAWLASVLETPTDLLEPSVCRHAAAILDAQPHLCDERVLGLLGSETLKLRLAAGELIAGLLPRRSDATLTAIIEDAGNPIYIREEAANILACSCGDRYESTWLEMLVRDGMPAAAHALATMPRLDERTLNELKAVVMSHTPTKPGKSIDEDKAALRVAYIALTLTVHGALTADESQPILKALPSELREQVVTQTLRGVASPWAAEVIDANRS